MLVGGEGVLGGALADTGFQPPPATLWKRAGQGRSADRTDQSYGIVGAGAAGRHDLVSGRVQQHDKAHALQREFRASRDQVGSDADQRLVDREQGLDLLLDAGNGARSQDSAVEDGRLEREIAGLGCHRRW